MAGTMLTAAQIQHFRTFGFLRLPALLSHAEITGVKDTAEAAWAAERATGKPPGGINLMQLMDTDAAPYEDRYHSWYGEFVEEQPHLHWLAADDRVRATKGGGVTRKAHLAPCVSLERTTRETAERAVRRTIALGDRCAGSQSSSLAVMRSGWAPRATGTRASPTRPGCTGTRTGAGSGRRRRT
jgi:hypothetical protein